MVFHGYLFWRRMFYRNEATGVNWTLQFQWPNAFKFHVQMFKDVSNVPSTAPFLDGTLTTDLPGKHRLSTSVEHFQQLLAPSCRGSRIDLHTGQGDLVGTLLGPCWDLVGIPGCVSSLIDATISQPSPPNTQMTRPLSCHAQPPSPRSSRGKFGNATRGVGEFPAVHS
jgi:hypothetical protein